MIHTYQNRNWSQICKGKAIPMLQVMKVYNVAGVDVLLWSFLTLVPGRGEWSAKGPATLTTVVRTTLHPLNRWLGGARHLFGYLQDEIDLLPLPGIKPWIVHIIV
jgi:hypothetical protein